VKLRSAARSYKATPYAEKSYSRDKTIVAWKGTSEVLFKPRSAKSQAVFRVHAHKVVGKNVC